MNQRVTRPSEVSWILVVSVSSLIVAFSLASRASDPDRLIEEAAQVHDPCVELHHAKDGATWSDLGLPDVEVPASFFSDFVPGSLICHSDLKAGRVEGVHVEFRSTNGEVELVVLVPRRDTIPSEMDVWHQYLDEMYGVGHNRMEPEGAFIVLTVNDQLSELFAESSRVLLRQGIDASLE